MFYSADEILHTYPATATELIAKYDPTLVGQNSIGKYYEHPIHGDEWTLMFVPKNEDTMYLITDREVPTDNELERSFEACLLGYSHKHRKERWMTNINRNKC